MSILENEAACQKRHFSKPRSSTVVAARRVTTEASLLRTADEEVAERRGRDGEEEAAARRTACQPQDRHGASRLQGGAGNGGGRVSSGGAEGVGDQHARSTGQGRGSSETNRED